MNEKVQAYLSVSFKDRSRLRDIDINQTLNFFQITNCDHTVVYEIIPLFPFMRQLYFAFYEKRAAFRPINWYI